MAMAPRYSVPWVGVVILAGVLKAAPADPAAFPFPGEKWPTRTAREAGLDEVKLAAARDYALTGEGAGMIVHRGSVVLAWGDTQARFSNPLPSPLASPPS